MSAIFNIILPVFLLIALGFALVRFEWLQRSHIDGIGQFLIRIGMPALIFHTISTRPIREMIDPVYLGGYTAASLFCFVAMWRFSRRRGQPPVLSVLNGLAGGMANSGFVGYPLLSMAIGSGAAVFFAMNVLVENLLILPLMFILIDLAQDGSQSMGVMLKRIVLNLMKNPIILSLLVGLLVSFFGLPVPSVLAKITSMLSAATAPLALLVIGAGLFGLSVRGNVKELLLIASGCLLLMPLLTVLFLWLLGADRDTLYTGALLASVPTPSIYAVFGRLHGFGQQTAAVMLMTTLASVLPIFLVLWLWH